jgi:tRNA modification GTPase
MEALADADLVLVVLDSSQPVEEEDYRLIELVGQRPGILIENKADITSSQFVVPGSQLRRVRASALTSEGIPELRAEILQHFGGEHSGLKRDWFPDPGTSSK